MGFEGFVILVLGLCVGSFLNVVIARVPRGESIVSPRSKCPRCGRQLTWYENIPVLSWIGLRGKCAGCGLPISPRYLIVEVLVGLLYYACWQRFGLTIHLGAALVFVSLLTALTFIDAELWILPFELTLPGIVLGVAFAIPNGLEAVETSAIGVAAGFISFRALELFGWKVFKKEALGAGDKFLFAMLGAFLGWQPLLGILLLASLQGSIFGIAKLVTTGSAGPKGEAAAEEVEEAPPTMTWEFTKRGLSLGRRALALVYSIFLQPIPDEPKDVEGEELEWQPGATNLPFGPWLALGGLEVLLLGPWLSDHLAFLQAGWMFAS